MLIRLADELAVILNQDRETEQQPSSLNGIGVSQAPQHEQPDSNPQQSSGTGFFVNSDATMLTNAHVIEGRLDKIQYQVEQLRTKRTRDTASAHRFRCCLRALCLDLDVAYQLDPLMVVGVRRDRTALTRNPVYPDFVAARPFIDALDGLIATGHADQLSVGNEGSGKSTRIRGTAKLRHALLIGERSTLQLEDHSELVRLSVGKRDNKKRITYEDTVQTMQWRNDLERINRNNSNYDISIDLSHVEWQALEAGRRAEAVTEAQRNRQPFDYARVDISRKRLHRVFNAKDWTKGGRFYGAWWQQIPKQYRKHITINGKPVCEYDFSAIHLRLLYAKEGAAVPHTVAPYDKPYGQGYRNVVKLAFNMLLRRLVLLSDHQGSLGLGPLYRCLHLLSRLWSCWWQNHRQRQSVLSSQFQTKSG